MRIPIVALFALSFSFSGLADPGSITGNAFEIVCAKADEPKASGSQIDIRVDGKEHNPCPGEFTTLRLVRPVLESGAAYKLYSFSNVANEKDVKLHMKKLGMRAQDIKKYSRPVHRSITSTVTRRTFFLFGIAAGAHSAYQLYELSTDRIQTPVLLAAPVVPDKK